MKAKQSKNVRIATGVAPKMYETENDIPKAARSELNAPINQRLGAMTIARVVDDPQLSKAILHSAEASITT